MIARDIAEAFADQYRDNEFVEGLLEICLEEESFDTFLVTLRDIAKARGGMTWLAKETGLDRTGLYRSLSHGARPEFTTVQAVLRAFGLKLTPKRIVQDNLGLSERQARELTPKTVAVAGEAVEAAPEAVTVIA